MIETPQQQTHPKPKELKSKFRIPPKQVKLIASYIGLADSTTRSLLSGNSNTISSATKERIFAETGIRPVTWDGPVDTIQYLVYSIWYYDRVDPTYRDVPPRPACDIEATTPSDYNVEPT